MKTENLLDPNYILAKYPDKDDLLFYLKSKFEFPSIELYVNGHGVVEGFTCVSFNGYIYSTLRLPATRYSCNMMPGAIKEIEANIEGTKKLIGVYKEELARSEKSNFFLKVAAGGFLLAALSFFMANHEARKTIEKLQLEISKPKLIQDTI